MTNAFRELAKQKAFVPERNLAQCAANGCPYRASMNMEGQWTCSAHAFALPHVWPRITDGLIDHKWLIEFIGEMQGMGHRHEDWREFAMRFWQPETGCQPDPKEEWVPYMNRMRGELLFRVGGCAKAPKIRFPQTSGNSFTELAESMRDKFKPKVTT